MMFNDVPYTGALADENGSPKDHTDRRVAKFNLDSGSYGYGHNWTGRDILGSWRS